MPIQNIIQNKNSIIGIWEIKEEEKELISIIDTRIFDKNRLLQIKHSQKRIEWLASRALMSDMLKLNNIEYLKLSKNKFGAPVLNESNYFVSLSHSHKYCAVILSKNKFIGIDIESNFDKAYLLRTKYMTDFELKLSGINKQLAALIWSSKESMYKAYGLKKLIFKEDMHILYFDDEKKIIDAQLLKTNRNIKIHCELNDDFVMTYI